MENPIKIHDLGVPLFLETPIGYDTVYKTRNVKKSSFTIYIYAKQNKAKNGPFFSWKTIHPTPGVPGLPNWIPSNNARNCAVPNSNSLQSGWPSCHGWLSCQNEKHPKRRKKKQRIPENGGKTKKKNTFFMKKHLRGVSWDVWQKKNINLSKCLKDHQQIDVMMSWFHVSFSGCKYWIISPSEPGTSRRFSWSTMACCH